MIDNFIRVINYSIRVSQSSAVDMIWDHVQTILEKNLFHDFGIILSLLLHLCQLTRYSHYFSKNLTWYTVLHILLSTLNLSSSLLKLHCATLHFTTHYSTHHTDLRTTLVTLHCIGIVQRGVQGLEPLHFYFRGG